jgi:hypothetical protein
MTGYIKIRIKLKWEFRINYNPHRIQNIIKKKQCKLRIKRYYQSLGFNTFFVPQS